MSKLSNSILVFGFFFLVVFFIYLPTRNARFVFDFIDFIIKFQKYGLSEPDYKDAGISETFTISLIAYTWFKLFALNTWAWHLLSCALHAFNAFLLFELLGYLYRRYHITGGRTAAFAASFLFLVLPYQTEAVVWGGDINYLVLGLLIFSSICIFFKFFETRESRYLILYFVTFLLGSFTHELGLFIFPAVLILLVVLARAESVTFLKNNLVFLSGSAAVYVIYFANRLLRGGLIGHYGADVHLNFSLSTIIPVFIMYVLKIVFLFAFSPLNWQTWIIHATEKRSFICAVLMTVSLVASFYYAVKFSRKYLLILGLFLLFILFVFPVLNLYFPYWVKIDADRYCYIPSAFLLGSIAPVFCFLNSPFKFLIPALYLVFSIKYLHYNIKSWRAAAELEFSLEKDFRWWNAGHVYILNRPDNFRGAYMYRGKQPNSFAPAFLKYCTDSIPGTPITEILGYNMNHRSDSVIVEKAGGHKLKVILSDWGIWFWRSTLGATNYEDELVKVTLDDYLHSYIVEFKKMKPQDVIIYAANGKWREVKGP